MNEVVSLSPKLAVLFPVKYHKYIDHSNVLSFTVKKLLEVCGTNFIAKLNFVNTSKELDEI